MRHHKRFLGLLPILAELLSLLMVGPGVGRAAVKLPGGPNPTAVASVLPNSHINFPFADDVEDAAFGAGYWLADPPWSRTTNDSHSPTHSWTDSPSAYYDNNKDISLTLASSIDLSTTTSPHLKFWHHYQLEMD